MHRKPYEGVKPRCRKNHPISRPRIAIAAQPYAGATAAENPQLIEHRPFASLGHQRLDWLDTHHHFSFAHYRDPTRTGWGALRVRNDDATAAGAVFPPPPHAD